MNTHNCSRVDGVWLQLPSDVRKKPRRADGDEVVLRVVEGDLHIRLLWSVLKHNHAKILFHAPTDWSFPGEIVDDCRAHAARE